MPSSQTSLEAEYVLLCITTSARENTYSTAFGRLPFSPLSSYPSYSRGAPSTLHDTVSPPNTGVFSAQANELGNLAYRTLSFTQKQCGGAVPAPGAFSEDDLQLLAEAAALLPQLRTHVDSMALHRYSQGVSGLASAANRYIDVQAPWALKKSDQARMRTVLYVLIEVLRHLALYSQPVTPRIGAALLEQLGARSSRDTAEA